VSREHNESNVTKEEKTGLVKEGGASPRKVPEPPQAKSQPPDSTSGTEVASQDNKNSSAN